KSEPADYAATHPNGNWAIQASAPLCRESAHAHPELAAAGARLGSGGTIITVFAKLLLNDAVAAEGAEHAAWFALAVTSVVIAVIALFSEAQYSVATDRGTLTGLGLEPAQRQLERGA